jgi:hypothetical protein
VQQPVMHKLWLLRGQYWILAGSMRWCTGGQVYYDIGRSGRSDSVCMVRSGRYLSDLVGKERALLK